MLLIAFGSMLLRRRQGWAFLAAFLVMFLGFLALIYGAEQHGNPALSAIGADQHASTLQSGGNLEGKETRFGIAQTSLFVAVTTAATTGSVNAMHDSLTPLGGLVPIADLESVPTAILASRVSSPAIYGSGAEALIAARGFGEAAPLLPDARLFPHLTDIASLPARPLYGRGADAKPMAAQAGSS